MTEPVRQADQAEEPPAPPLPPQLRRHPLLAFGLSWLAPGLGHLYAGNAGIVPWILGIVYGAWMLWVVALLLNVPGVLAEVFLLASVALQVILIPLAAARTAARAPRPYTLQPFNHRQLYLLYFAGFVVLFGLGRWIVREYVVQAFRIPSGAMEPTVLVDDRILVDRGEKARTRIEREDIVVFQSVEEAGMMVIKRIVGMPGDTLAMRGGVLFRNGIEERADYTRGTDSEKSEEPLQRAKMRQWQVHYLVGDPTAYNPDIHEWGPLVVPADAYFMMGDNRDASYDSRYYGFVPAENIVGQPRMIYYSYDRGSYRPLPRLSAIRWNRLGLRLH